MPFSLPSFPPPPAPEPHPIVRTVAREDVLWNRPVFKAPPLEFFLRGIDVKRFAQELPGVGLVNR